MGYSRTAIHITDSDSLKKNELHCKSDLKYKYLKVFRESVGLLRITRVFWGTTNLSIHWFNGKIEKWKDRENEVFGCVGGRGVRGWFKLRFCCCIRTNSEKNI